MLEFTSQMIPDKILFFITTLLDRVKKLILTYNQDLQSAIRLQGSLLLRIHSNLIKILDEIYQNYNRSCLSSQEI